MEGFRGGKPAVLHIAGAGKSKVCGGSRRVALIGWCLFSRPRNVRSHKRAQLSPVCDWCRRVRGILINFQAFRTSRSASSAVLPAS